MDPFEESGSDRSDLPDLVARLRAGDESAALLIVERYGRHIIRIVWRRLHRAPELRRCGDSDDFLQQIWYEFLRSVKKGGAEFDSSQRLLAYLRTVARHQMDLARRRLHSQRRDVAREKEMTVLEPMDWRHAPPGAALEDLDEITEALRPLSDSDRKLVEVWAEGWSWKEIKALLSSPKSLAALCRQLSRILARLRREQERKRRNEEDGPPGGG